MAHTVVCHTITSVCIFPWLFHTISKVLKRRICLTIKSFFTWWTFPLFSWPLCLIQGWYWEEKFDASYTWWSNVNSTVSRKKKQCLLKWNFSVICIIRVFLTNFFIQHGIFFPAPWYATTYNLLLFHFADVYRCWKKHNLCVWWSCTHKVGKKGEEIIIY